MDSKNRAMAQLGAAVEQLVQADPRPAAVIAREAWTDIEPDSARRQLSAVRAGRRWLGAERAQQLADALEVDLEELYASVERKKPNRGP
ncbi:hypothetical protein G6O69_20910 [Pseudenhygromyxa sp. WMMC2535]|uniref:hypothetical protein n=1 Tax=Pseudenhygromyxa sp. WMMC2535 TaxID=2712867 RepID=UPI001551738E|nr:hypothetical protein [Pseudenhygromyxa sp. WMMC2535]NVB40314.1 hypothetical protein [Pseudenhygromyxa sp. WMMC2535]